MPLLHFPCLIWKVKKKKKKFQLERTLGNFSSTSSYRSPESALRSSHTTFTTLGAFKDRLSLGYTEEIDTPFTRERTDIDRSKLDPGQHQAKILLEPGTSSNMLSQIDSDEGNTPQAINKGTGRIRSSARLCLSSLCTLSSGREEIPRLSKDRIFLLESLKSSDCAI
ncbi:hypothetical protein BJX64DRAFT_1656 [Aspergillus heterothallicus]